MCIRSPARLSTFSPKRILSFYLSRERELWRIFSSCTTKRSNFADSVLQQISQKCLSESSGRQKLAKILNSISWEHPCWLSKLFDIHIFSQQCFLSFCLWPFPVSQLFCQIGVSSSRLPLLPPAGVRVHVCRRVSQHVRVVVRICWGRTACRAIRDWRVVCVSYTWKKDLSLTLGFLHVHCSFLFPSFCWISFQG